MALLKNKGPLLTSEYYGDIDLIPKEYRAKIGIRQKDQEVPLDILPDLLVDPLVQSQVVQTRTDERKKSNFELIGDINTPLEDEVFIKETCQIGHHTRTLVPEGTELPAANCLLVEGNQHNLGNGMLDQNLVTVDDMFQEFTFRRERPVVTPEDFRAKLQQLEQSALICGTAPLGIPEFEDGDGLISVETHQVDACKYRASERTIDLLDLPKVNLNYRTNKFKQVETAARWLRLDTDSPALPTALRDTSFTKLGDGTALEERNSTEELFENRVSSVEVPDLLPDIFKATLPTYSKEYNVTDLIDDPPLLDPGDFARSEEQYDVFNKRVRTRGRAGITYPQSVIALRHIGGEKFGGEITQVAGFLDDSEPAVETGLEVVNSEVTNLGNGTWFRQTEKLDVAIAWPTLYGLEFNKDMQVYTPTEEQVVDPSYTVPALTDAVETLKPIDQWHTQRRRITLTPTATDVGSAIISYRYHPFQFPGTLDYGRLITFDHKEGYRKASALLAKHTIRTWWVTSATAPTVGDTDLGTFDIDVKEIISDTVNVPIYNEDNTTLAETFAEVLHDDITNTLGAFYPATTPSFTQYYIGTPSGASLTGSVYVLTAPGTGYTVGGTVVVCGTSCTILSIGVSGSIVAISQPAAPPPGVIYTSLTNAGACSVTGGGGSGAAFDELVVGYDVPIPGSGWVGTEKCIAADIAPTEVPGQWKVVTESVVMR